MTKSGYLKSKFNISLVKYCHVSETRDLHQTLTISGRGADLGDHAHIYHATYIHMLLGCFLNILFLQKTKVSNNSVGCFFDFLKKPPLNVSESDNHWFLFSKTKKKLKIKESPILIISKTLKNHWFSWKNQEKLFLQKTDDSLTFVKFLRTTVIYQNQFFEDFEKWEIGGFIPQLKTCEYLPLILRTAQHRSPSSNFPGYI